MRPLVRLYARPHTAAALAAALLLGGCAQGGGELGYYWQSVSGHLQLMWAANAMDDWIARPGTPPVLRERLRLAQRARQFAVQALHLPDNPSYRRYADLRRSAAVWNVVAAPPYSLQLHTWCFPVLGCVGYRGYFSQAAARAEADRLSAQGLEVDVYGVPAYSTLGTMNWIGGDPLLSTFVHWPEGDFVRLLFHELAHQKVYAEGDTLFNESFATAVGRIGGAQWLRTQASAAARAEAAASDDRREAFRRLTRETRAQLEQIYASKPPPGQDMQALEAMKKETMQDFRERYAALASTWPAAQRAGYDHWVATANNASFGAQAAYDEWVPAFEALFERSARQWPRFYDAVKTLADQTPEQRHAALRALLTPAAKDPPRA
jgi:predicted aminopeptidase